MAVEVAMSTVSRPGNVALPNEGQTIEQNEHPHPTLIYVLAPP